MVLGFDGPQVLFHLVSVHQSEWGLLRHDHNYGRNAPLRQAHGRRGCLSQPASNRPAATQTPTTRPARSRTTARQPAVLGRSVATCSMTPQDGHRYAVTRYGPPSPVHRTRLLPATA